MVQIQPIQKNEIKDLVALIRELARFNDVEHEVTVTEEQLTAAIFSEPPQVFAQLAHLSGKTVGMAIYCPRFASFTGKSALYLDDLYVQPEHRGKGIGSTLLKAVAKHTLEGGFSRLEWWTRRWNENAIQFYKKIHASAQEEELNFRFESQALREFVHK